MSTPQGPDGPQYQPQPVYTEQNAAATESGKGGVSRGVVIGGIGLGAALIVGGGAFAVVNGMSGGGDQPADVLPGDAAMYFRVDIDPSAGQKVAATRFMDQLPPEVTDALNSSDWREEAFALAEQSGDLGDYSYAEDIEPWLGDRVGVSLSPPADGESDDPVVAIALQVTDQGAAEEFFGGLPDAADMAYYVDGDYVVLTSTEWVDGVRSAADSGSLADNADFTGDMEALGEDGIASMWMDLPTINEMSEGALGSLGSSMMGMPPAYADDMDDEDLSGEVPTDLPQIESGRFAATLRFESDYVELHGITRDLPAQISPSDTPNIATTLPADTMAAFGFSGGEQAVGPMIEAIQQLDPEGYDQFVQQAEAMGISLPGDAEVILGRSFGIGVGADVVNSLAGMSGTMDLPIGVKVDTSDPARFEEIITTLTGMDPATAGMIQTQVDGDTVSVALTQEYLSAMSEGETLADNDAFNLAVADAQDADSLFYLDFRPLAPLVASETPSDFQGLVNSLGGIGMSAHQTSDTEGEFTLRVTATSE